ncbi:MAG: hypothetical protein K0S43_1904, partial [Cellulosimicrobium sp.]|nr:hypothetical protein [Cellulosimicrobium sp.]
MTRASRSVEPDGRAAGPYRATGTARTSGTASATGRGDTGGSMDELELVRLHEDGEHLVL